MLAIDQLISQIGLGRSVDAPGGSMRDDQRGIAPIVKFREKFCRSGCTFEAIGWQVANGNIGRTSFQTPDLAGPSVEVQIRPQIIRKISGGQTGPNDRPDKARNFDLGKQPSGPGADGPGRGFVILDSGKQDILVAPMFGIRALEAALSPLPTEKGNGVGVFCITSHRIAFANGLPGLGPLSWGDR